jgi:hypothetical protein
VYDPDTSAARCDGIVWFRSRSAPGAAWTQKRLLYRRIADRLAEAAARRDGVWVNLLRS